VYKIRGFMYLIQILLALFALFALLKTKQKFSLGDIGRRDLLVWVLLWVAVIVVAIAPNSAAVFAKMTGVGRGADLVVYLALALLFYLFFRMTVRIEKMKREITVLTREISLKEKNSESK